MWQKQTMQKLVIAIDILRTTNDHSLWLMSVLMHLYIYLFFHSTYKPGWVLWYIIVCCCRPLQHEMMSCCKTNWQTTTLKEHKNGINLIDCLFTTSQWPHHSPWRNYSPPCFSHKLCNFHFLANRRCFYFMSFFKVKYHLQICFVTDQ